MGLFGDLDIASAEDNPWAVPANTYEADLYEVEVRENKDKTKKGLSFTFKISSGEHKGKTVAEWKTLPTGADTPEDKRNASYIKQRLTSLGVPESRMNTVEVTDLVGTPVIMDVVVNGEYTNVKSIKVRGEGESIETQEFKGFSG